MARSHAASDAGSKRGRSRSAGMPIRCIEAAATGSPSGRSREYGSAGSRPAMAATTIQASPTSLASTDTQSSERQAGTTPLVETRPGVGFSPTRPHNPAGTRPDPAVSVPSANGTNPAATATAEPRGRSTRHSTRRPRVARHRMRRAGAVQPGGELVEVGLPDRDRAGRDETLNCCGMPVRGVGEGGAGGGGRHERDVDIVFDRERDAPKRQPGPVRWIERRDKAVDRPRRSHMQEDPGIVASDQTIPQRGQDLRRRLTRCILRLVVSDRHGRRHHPYVAASAVPVLSVRRGARVLPECRPDA